MIDALHPNNSRCDAGGHLSGSCWAAVSLFLMYRDVVIGKLMMLLVWQQKLVALMFSMGGHRFGFLQH
ncbi:hypothetical protein Pyn_08482 [Prunus yedoensis var. nudiflora]|uniref:Uncharacterized protein n=1 Tax=Prunus yedoensis var. nudiflora TaxID=2094558 RepID=A0A314Z7M3_PRUYE|nr:hypothetical protein Pyn_08482 [Prunus yedoensis var. nudiflora]